MMKYFFSLPPRPDRLWHPPSLLSNGYQTLLSRVKRQRDRGVKLTTHLHLVPKLRMRGAIPLLHPLRLHCMELSSAQGLYLHHFFYGVNWLQFWTKQGAQEPILFIKQTSSYACKQAMLVAVLPHRKYHKISQGPAVYPSQPTNASTTNRKRKQEVD
jgi:hypothetical protein